MTISSNSIKAGPYTCSGTPGPYAFSFKCFDTAQPQVTRTSASAVDSALVLTSDYSVALNADQDNNPGGTITTVTSYGDGKITIVSNADYLQQTDITNAGGFYPQTVEDMVDKVVLEVQQVAETAGRAVRLPISSSASSLLPAPTASTFLGWNALGTAIINYAGIATAAVSAAMSPVVAAATLALGRAALGATATGDAIFTAVNALAARVALGTTTAAQQQTDTAFTTAGAAPAYTATTTPAYGAYATNERMRIKFHAATNGAATLNRDTLGVKNLKQYDAAGFKVNPVVVLGQLSDVEYDGTDYVILDPLGPVSIGYFNGFTPSTPGASANFTFQAGQAADSTNSAYLRAAAAITKTTGAWAVGTAAGGLDTGAIAINTTYHWYAIRRPDTGVTDICCSLSAAAPTFGVNIPAAYTQYRYLCPWRTNASSQWVGFTFDPSKDDWRLTTSVLDVSVGSASPGTGLLTLTLGSIPTGRNVFANFNYTAFDTAGQQLANFFDLATAQEAPSSTVAPLAQSVSQSTSNSGANNSLSIRTNTSAQIGLKLGSGGAGGVTYKVATLGHTFRMGSI